MKRETKGHLKARCPECLAPIWLKDSVEQWDPVTCPECHTALEVTRIKPPTLDYMSDYDEDFDDEWDDEWE